MRELLKTAIVDTGLLDEERLEECLLLEAETGRLNRALRRQVFSQFLGLPTKYYDRNSSGVLLSKLTYDIEQVANCTSQVITTLVRDGLTIIGLMGYMFWVNLRLSLFILVVGPLIAGMIRLVSRHFRRYSARIQRSMGDVTRVAEQVLEGTFAEGDVAKCAESWREHPFRIDACGDLTQGAEHGAARVDAERQRHRGGYRVCPRGGFGLVAAAGNSGADHPIAGHRRQRQAARSALPSRLHRAAPRRRPLHRRHI